MTVKWRKPPVPVRRLSDGVSVETFFYSSTESNRPPPRFQGLQRFDVIGLRDVRQIWWRQFRLGNRLPPEHGLIVLDGGR